MSEKNEIKIKLSTAIFMFIILVLIAALGIVYYLGFIRNNNENAEGVNEVKNTEARIEEKDDIEKDNTKKKCLSWDYMTLMEIQ